MQLSNIIHLHLQIFALSVSEYVTTNVTVKPVSQRLYTKQITVVLWSPTCAAVKLYYFKAFLK